MGNAMEITGAALIVLAAVLGFLVGKKQKTGRQSEEQGVWYRHALRGIHQRII